MSIPPVLVFLSALALHAGAARAVSVALLPDGVLTPAERDDVRSAVLDAGHTLLDDEEVLAAVDGARGACVHDDVPCLARIALLADADVVVSFARRADEIDVVVVDADPRVGRATSPSSRVGAAVVDAIATRSAVQQRQEPVTQEPVTQEPVTQEPVTQESVASAPITQNVVDEARDRARPPVSVERAATSTPSQTRAPWALAGAGLAGAGLVALAAGGYAAVLANSSIQDAEAAPFQDDAARFGETANGQLWLSGGALALGVGAMAGGAALIFMDGEP